MKKGFFLTIASVFFLLLSCKNEENNTSKIPVKRFLHMEIASWFLGEWNNTVEEKHTAEIWIKKSDSIYAGQSYMLKANDTLFSERMTIEQKNDSLFYHVKVKNQNNDEVVTFYATTISESQIVFENPKHDFPNKIVYNKINNDSIVAGIYGANKYQSFPMKKKKN
jgi:hypothetical protein